MNIILVACGGFIGAIARCFISVTFNKHVIGTWIANISGSLLLAWIFRNYLQGNISDALWLFWGVGFSGAFTTFSTFGNEMIQFLMARLYMKAFIYGITSFGTSLVLVYSFLFS